ncbi:hypothetical protein GCM10010277_10430 [Streptomyces longisporoflavus]|nr:hypothetical protein GCM10010277_10430 [Streptomyces longisporoflavus]
MGDGPLAVRLAMTVPAAALYALSTHVVRRASWADTRWRFLVFLGTLLVLVFAIAGWRRWRR